MLANEWTLVPALPSPLFCNKSSPSLNLLSGSTTFSLKCKLPFPRDHRETLLASVGEWCLAPSGLRGGQPGGGSVEEAPGHPHTGRSDPASQTRARWHHLKQTQSIPRAGSSAGLGGAWASAPLASLGSQCCWSGHPPLEACPGAGKMATEALFGLALWPQWPLQEVVGRPPPEGRQPVLLGTSPPESHFPSSTRSGSLSTPQSQEDGTRKSGPLGAVVCEPGSPGAPAPEHHPTGPTYPL